MRDDVDDGGDVVNATGDSVSLGGSATNRDPAASRNPVLNADSTPDEDPRTLTAVLWDMDGTLIDSEPYWHESEMLIARDAGGRWNEELAWECSGTPVPSVARRMIALGTRLDAEEIGRRMIGYVARREAERIPWIPGVEDVLRSLVAAGVPSVLVTTSPRSMAENLVRQAPSGAFVGYVCGDDDLPKKPDPAPYRAAARFVGVDADDARAMVRCVALEDSMTGLRSASASGATTLAQTRFTRTDVSDGPQFASLDGYEGVDARALEEVVRRRLALLG